MALEVEPECEQLFGIRCATRNGSACHQAERDRRRARPETAGAGNAFRERKAEAVRRGESRERTDGEMVGLRFAAVFVRARARSTDRARRRRSRSLLRGSPSWRERARGSSARPRQAVERVGILEPVSGEHEHHARAFGKLPEIDPCQRRRGRRLAEDAFLARERSPGHGDLVVGDRDDCAAASGRALRPPRRGGPESGCGSQRHSSSHGRPPGPETISSAGTRRPRGSPSRTPPCCRLRRKGERARSGGPPSCSMISSAAVFCPSIRSGFVELTTTAPSCSASSSAAANASSKVPSTSTRRAPAARTCASFELAGPPAACTMIGLDPCPCCVRRRRRRRVPCRCADDRARSGLDCLRDGDGHAPVLERTGRVGSLALQPDLDAGGRPRAALHAATASTLRRASRSESTATQAARRGSARVARVSGQKPRSVITRNASGGERTSRQSGAESRAASTRPAGASCVTRSSAALPLTRCCVNCAIDTSCSAKQSATCASTPGRSATSRWT